MPRLLIVALGQLGGAVLESAARRGFFDEIVIATRNVSHARAKANNARIGAALEGRYPRIEAVPFDLNSADAPAQLAQLAPDVAFAAPSLLPWWRLDALAVPLRDVVREAPFATFLACHLAPMLVLRDAWAASGLTTPWVGASYPDVVNHILSCTGQAPTCGIGNVAEVIPKIRFVLSEALGARPDDFSVRLVAQHAFEYYCYAPTGQTAVPPYLLEARLNGHDVSAAAIEKLFAPYPIPYELDFNQITASSGADVFEALAGGRAVSTHVPAPAGMLGGYPVRVSREGVALELASNWNVGEAETVNRRSLEFDGIADIDAHGRVVFTPEAARALEQVSGLRCVALAPDDAAPVAHAIVSAVHEQN